MKLIGLGLNLVQNPNFEFQEINWYLPAGTAEITTEKSFEGLYSLKLFSPVPRYAHILEFIEIDTSKDYYLRFWVFRESGNVRLHYWCYDENYSPLKEIYVYWTPTASVWTEIEKTYLATDWPEGTKFFRFGPGIDSGVSYFDAFFFTTEKKEYDFADYPVYPYFRKTTNLVKRFKTQDGRTLTLQQGKGKDRYELNFTAISQAQFVEFRDLFENYHLFEFEPGLEGEKNRVLVYWTGTEFRMNELAGGPYYSGQIVLEEV
jgi:hypothetical protein